LCGLWQSTHAGTWLGAFSHSVPRTTFACTASMRTWHCSHVCATFWRAMLERGSVCGSWKCEVWQLVHTAVVSRPFLYRPSPWIDSL